MICFPDHGRASCRGPRPPRGASAVSRPAHKTEDLVPAVQEYYQANPKVYPPDEDGQWQPHWVFVGEVLQVLDRR